MCGLQKINFKSHGNCDEESGHECASAAEFAPRCPAEYRRLVSDAANECLEAEHIGNGIIELSGVDGSTIAQQLGVAELRDRRVLSWMKLFIRGCDVVARQFPGGRIHRIGKFDVRWLSHSGRSQPLMESKL